MFGKYFGKVGCCLALLNLETCDVSTENTVSNCYILLLYKIRTQIQLLADLNLKKTPQLVELINDSKVRVLNRINFF